MIKLTSRKMAAFAIFGAASLGSLATVAFAQKLPDGAGKELVQAICTACHDLTAVTEGIGYSRQDWDNIVQSMIDMGAAIKPEQVPLITDYLARNFPPKSER